MEHGTNLFQIQKLLGLVESTLKRSSELMTSESMGFISQVQTTHASQFIIHRNILFIPFCSSSNPFHRLKINTLAT